MNTSQIKTFAINSRQILKEGVINKISSLGFNSAGEPVFGLPQKIQGATVYAGKFFDESFYDAWMSLYQRIKAKGIKDVYEEAAYTWFNRLVAIRIMQKNNLIEPVLVYSSEETRIPRIVAQARSGHLMTEVKASDKAKLDELLNDDSKTNEQFALLIENFCKYNPVIYNCFGGIEKYISILLPDNILVQGGFIDILNHTSYITDEDYTKSELIGWLYQFYIAEKKDEVFESFKKGKKAEAEDIPAATQIFTPNWIVKYMVQNTIGRIYLDNNPYSSLSSEMKYLVGDKTPDEAILRLNDLQEYKMIDPACGSGHILVEAFDLFYSMYREEGYSSRQSIENILKKNIIGIDLDTRAKQLATFALLMKAVKVDESFLDCEVLPRVLDMPRPYTEWTQNLSGAIDQFYMGCSDKIKKETLDAFELLTQAENLGSIMKFDLSDETRNLMQIRFKEWDEQNINNGEISEIMESLRIVLCLSDNYTAVAANPPYMGANNMNSKLSSYVVKNYKEGKTDFCTVFMLVCSNLLSLSGKYAMINLPSWLFISSFEPIRRFVVANQHIDSMLHMGRGIFGIDWGSVAFTVTNAVYSKNSEFYRLHKRNFQHIYFYHIGQLFLKVKENHDFKVNFDKYREIDVTESEIYPFENENIGSKLYYQIEQQKFCDLPGYPIGYWISDKIRETFTQNLPLSAVANPCVGLQTADNGRFLRQWFEVYPNRIGYNYHDAASAADSGKKWFPYNKGGSFRKWFGNISLIVNWERDGYEIKHFTDSKGKVLSRPQNTNYYFRKAITWSLTTSVGCAYRYNPGGAIFDVNGMSMFPKNELDSFILLGVLNSKLYSVIANIINPTLALQCGDVGKFPAPHVFSKEDKDLIFDLVSKNIEVSKQDWNSYEISWEFKENPLITFYKLKKGETYFASCTINLNELVDLYKCNLQNSVFLLHNNEEEINRIVIESYHLQDELTPDVPLDEVTILQQGEISIENNEIVWHDDVIIKQLISYAIGCWMGRYRLDKPGLNIAHPNPTSEEVCTYQYNSQNFEIDDDGIIPMMSCDSMFEDNGYNRIVEFIKVAFGEENLTENLNFIEKALGKSLEDYMMKDFWKDHKKMYQNRPIYWLFSSKKGAFQCLVYMHRMNPYTAERVRTKYLLRHIEDLKGRISLATERGALLTTAERKNLLKMQKDLDECLEYHDILHEVADRQINFDLDDGVVVNYAKFGDVLAKIK